MASSGGDEGIDAIKMGVAMIFFASILGIVVYNTSFGKEMLNSTVEEIEKSTFDETFKSFQQFTGDGLVVTSAAAYAFIGYNENNIASVTCYVHDAHGITAKGMDDTCLKSHLQGELRMKAVYNELEGQYDLYLYPA